MVVHFCVFLCIFVYCIVLYCIVLQVRATRHKLGSPRDACSGTKKYLEVDMKCRGMRGRDGNNR